MTKRLAVIVLGVATGAVLIGWAAVKLEGDKSKVLAQAFDQLLAAESLHAKTVLTINLPGRWRGVDRPFTVVLAQIEGDVVQADDGTPELAGRLRLEGRGRGNIFFADGDVRILQDQVLFNLVNLPVLLNPSGSLVKKWTRVPVPLLRTRNGEQVKMALADLVSKVSYAGKETIDGATLWHYQGSLAAEEQQALVEVLRRGVSGNQALGVVARLLRANEVDELDIWVDKPARQVRRISAHFARPLADGGKFDFARLTLDFSAYNQPVVIDRPAPALTVKPDVFARIFGSGEVEEIQSE